MGLLFIFISVVCDSSVPRDAAEQEMVENYCGVSAVYDDAGPGAAHSRAQSVASPGQLGDSSGGGGTREEHRRNTGTRWDLYPRHNIGGSCIIENHIKRFRMMSLSSFIIRSKSIQHRFNYY